MRYPAESNGTSHGRDWCSELPSPFWLGGSPGLRALRRSGEAHELRSNHYLHRHPKLHRTTLCVAGPRNHGQRAVPIGSALFPLRAGFSTNVLVQLRRLSSTPPRTRTTASNPAPATNHNEQLALLRPGTFWSYGGAFATAVITLMVC